MSAPSRPLARPVAALRRAGRARHGRALAAAVAVALGAGCVTPAVAAGQEPGGSSTSSTSTSSTLPGGSSTTLPDGSSTTSTTTDPDGTGTSSTTTPESTSTTTPGNASVVDPAAPPLDPMAGAFLTPEDQQLYEALDGIEDARSGFYASQPAFDPAVANAVLEPEVLRARAELASAVAAQAAAVAHEERARAQLAAAEADLGGLDDTRRDRVADAADAEAELRRRVVEAYVRSGGGVDVRTLSGATDATEAAQRAALLDAVLDDDVASARRARQAVDGLDESERASVGRLATARRAVSDAAAARRDADWQRLAAESAVAMYEAGSHVAIAGFVFPVAGDVTFIDSYGAPRNVGTGYEHWHEGTDVMAAMGTPLVAVEDGVITRARPNSLGGNAIRLRGASGHGYYYAHLADYAPGISEGVPVTAGQLIGFVGDTGDARGGAPHVHFEIHRPGTDEPVNPYPLLAVTWRAVQDARAAGAVS